MKLKLTLEIEVDTEEQASVIEDRLKCVDYDSVLSDSIEYALDEFGEVENVELYDVEVL